ncbi:ferrous iron transport protein B [Candidatus Dojkabacteria bacterium]|nr:ferrous iron transport protein B [Candidatus Dojkabacteria bacterium]
MNNIKTKTIVVGLIGNPNTGKTSLLNCLTGASYHVGNWPGKTVQKCEGKVNYKGKEIRFVDLPGIYSIAPFSEEEEIARNFMLSRELDIVVQIVDVNTLVRNLFLTMELLVLGKKLLLAFNFNKEAKRRGVKIEYQKIEKILKIPIVNIEAHTGENKCELIDKIVRISKKDYKVPKYIHKFLKPDKEINHKKARQFLNESITPLVKTKSERILYKIDSIFLNKFTAFPILLLLMYLMFLATFKISLPLVDGVEYLFSLIGEIITSLNPSPILRSFITDGVIGGLGAVLSFTPIILIFYIFIYLFEDTGYLSRTVVLVDRLFEKIGISGRSFIPLILGFGCNVSAVLATRTIHNKKEKLIAMFLVPFIPCSACLPLNIYLAITFFPSIGISVVTILYLLNILVGLVVGVILSKFVYKTGDTTLLLELPPYRKPVIKNILKRSWAQTVLFIKKAGSIIFLAIIGIWFLSSFPLGVEYGSSDSLLGQIGNSIILLFNPLGFGFWEFSVSLIFGFLAKEIFIGLFGVLFGVGEGGLQNALLRALTPFQAISFLVFANLYTPCIATCSAIKNEVKSWKFLIARIVTSFAVAWVMAFLVYNLLNIFTKLF